MGEPTPGQPVDELDLDIDTDSPSGPFGTDDPDSPAYLGGPDEEPLVSAPSGDLDDDIFGVGDLAPAASADTGDDLGAIFENTGIVPPHITDAPDFGDDLDLDGADLDLPDLDLPDLPGPDATFPTLPDLDDLPAMDDMPSLGPDADDDLDLDLGAGGLDADDMNDPLSGI
jgi:hypothetical protein